MEVSCEANLARQLDRCDLKIIFLKIPPETFSAADMTGPVSVLLESRRTVFHWDEN